MDTITEIETDEYAHMITLTSGILLICDVCDDPADHPSDVAVGRLEVGAKLVSQTVKTTTPMGHEDHVCYREHRFE